MFEENNTLADTTMVSLKIPKCKLTAVLQQKHLLATQKILTLAKPLRKYSSNLLKVGSLRKDMSLNP